MCIVSKYHSTYMYSVHKYLKKSKVFFVLNLHHKFTGPTNNASWTPGTTQDWCEHYGQVSDIEPQKGGGCKLQAIIHIYSEIDECALRCWGQNSELF